MRFAAPTPVSGFVALLLGAAISAAQAQQPAATQPAPPAASSPASSGPSAVPASLPASAAKLPTMADRRRAAKLFLEASRLYEAQQFEPALQSYERAAAMDPANPHYSVAAEVARSHAVTALIQQAAEDRTKGNPEAARNALQHALLIEPGNTAVSDRLRDLADDAVQPQTALEGLENTPPLGGFEHLDPQPGVRTFHARGSARQIIQQVFHAYGIEATVDDSIRANAVRFDLDNVDFYRAAQVLGMLTHSFYVPVDAHRTLVAADTREMRSQYMRNGLETLYLSGLNETEMKDMGNMAKTVFEVQQAAVNPTAATLTLRAPEATLRAFNATYQDLIEGRSEVQVEARVIQLAHKNARNTGVQPTQTVTAFNVYSEANSILNANQGLVQQIISSGLAAPGDWQTILGILIASGQVSSALFSNGLVTFGGGLGLTALSPGPFTANLNLNSSDSRELDDYRLRLEDGEEGTLKSGTRYPIMTSSFSSLGTNNLNIPGLTGAGTSSSLNSILSSLQGAATDIPQVQYQDIGLVLKARPRVLRSGEVALSVDMKFSALTGSTIDGVPILANRAYTGVSTLRANEAVVIASEIDENESRAISGYPGLSEIPGLNNIMDKTLQRNYATLLIILTPHVIRMPHGSGHSLEYPVPRTLLR